MRVLGVLRLGLAVFGRNLSFFVSFGLVFDFLFSQFSFGLLLDVFIHFNGFYVLLLAFGFFCSLLDRLRLLDPLELDHLIFF